MLKVILNFYERTAGNDKGVALKDPETASKSRDREDEGTAGKSTRSRTYHLRWIIKLLHWRWSDEQPSLLHKGVPDDQLCIGSVDLCPIR